MSLKLHCPELELRHSTLSWTSYPSAAKEVDTSIDILELRGKTHLRSLDDEGVTYKTGLGHQEVVNHLSAQPVSSPLCAGDVAFMYIDLEGIKCRAVISHSVRSP